MMNLNTENTAEKPSGPRLPVIPDMNSALMDSIRKGAQLKKVEASSTSSTSSNTDLLSQIRGGIELRPVTERPVANRSSGDGAGADALADALRRALELRKTAINGGSSSSSSSEESENDDWSD